MNAPDGGFSPDAQSARRRKLAVVASRLLATGSAASAELDWNSLCDAPDWLALDDAGFLRLQCRLGALIYAPDIRLWIDQPRLTAARNAVGQDWLRDLCAERPMTPMPIDGIDCVHMNRAEDVTPCLTVSGAALLAASLDEDTLRNAVIDMLGISRAATIHLEVARAFVLRAMS